ncbi:MAG TPA: sugar phosphate isomerase/epimerase [Nitrososphaeraceae archaeon]|jgi:sugar phosphate isomerase/epimerase
MKLAFSSNAFKAFSIDTAIKEIKALGYEGVEILCDYPHAYPPEMSLSKIGALKASLTENHLDISNMNAFSLYAINDVYNPSWIDRSAEQRKVRIQHTLNCIALANNLGAKSLSTEPGGIYDRNREDIRYLRNLFLGGLTEVSIEAEKNKIKVLVEPEPKLLIETSNDFLEVMKEIKSDWVGLNFDIGHFFCVGEDPVQLVYDLADYIGHFHLADIAQNRIHNHLIPGEGVIDFKQVLKAISDIGYDGYITVELYPYQKDPIRAARKAHDYLIDIMS